MADGILTVARVRVDETIAAGQASCRLGLKASRTGEALRP